MSSTAVPRRSLLATMAPYLRPRPIAALLLGISSGFPLALLLGTMGYWLSKVGSTRRRSASRSA
ncbi:hypothetical protein [Sphingomonas sp. Ant20]|uniref:hypothetical protein n=1 Tax=Sphingomonas sp. Ant20 TaxID=104605 RepID=UPI0027413223|nr:hypothetical protein [Sphingomonas sp. Ant20]